jgi:FeS assembly SUF system regulator
MAAAGAAAAGSSRAGKELTMLRVTKLADYGIVVMTHLAGHPGQFSARDLAHGASLPLPMVSKILKLLSRAHLLASHRGTKGGYTLARSPQSITIAEIIRALEGPIAVTECTDSVNGACDLDRRCPVRSNWQRINQAIRGALEQITLAEMSHPFQDRLVNVMDYREHGIRAS